jgi:hypothetical protein
VLLSIAMATGRVLMTRWSAKTYCGCALAAGLRGVGKAPTLVAFNDESFLFRIASDTWKGEAYKEWPWLDDMKVFPNLPAESEYRWLFEEIRRKAENRKAETIISVMFHEVEAGRMTFDQVIDWVRQNEPPEPAVEAGNVCLEQEKCAV